MICILYNHSTQILNNKITTELSYDSIFNIQIDWYMKEEEYNFYKKNITEISLI